MAWRALYAPCPLGTQFTDPLYSPACVLMSFLWPFNLTFTDWDVNILLGLDGKISFNIK